MPVSNSWRRLQRNRARIHEQLPFCTLPTSFFSSNLTDSKLKTLCSSLGSIVEFSFKAWNTGVTKGEYQKSIYLAPESTLKSASSDTNDDERKYQQTVYGLAFGPCYTLVGQHCLGHQSRHHWKNSHKWVSCTVTSIMCFYNAAWILPFINWYYVKLK